MEVYKFKCKCCGSTRYNKIDDHAYQCEYCGNTEEIIQKTVEKIIIKEVPNETDKQKLIAEKKEAFTSALINIIIVVCLGVFGVHKFLKGKILLGIIYLCSYGLFGVGIFIDAIKALKKLIIAAKEYRLVRG